MLKRLAINLLMWVMVVGILLIGPALVYNGVRGEIQPAMFLTLGGILYTAISIFVVVHLMKEIRKVGWRGMLLD